MSFYGVGKGSANSLFKEIVSAQDSLIEEGVRTEDPTVGSDRAVAANDRAYLENRIPWLISTIELLREGKGITWQANPSEISWNLALRESISKTATGTVTHYWRHPQRQTGFDEYKLSLSLQTGNLLPYEEGAASDRVSQGLLNFYDFMQIVDSPKLTDRGEVNYTVIKYNSTIFPNLTLLGMFDPSGIRFTDSSRSPHEVSSWSIDFIVQDTQPRLSISNGSLRKGDLLATYIDNIKNNARFR